MLEVTYEHADCFFKYSEDLEVRMRSPIEQNSDRMKYDECCKIQCILTTAREIAIELIVYAVPEVCLLEKRALFWL